MPRCLTRLILLLALGFLAPGEASALAHIRAPQNELAGPKTASGIFSETIAMLRHAAASQAAELQQEKTSHSYDFAPASPLAAEKGTSLVSTATKVGGRAPEFVGGRVSQSGFLRAAEKYLGSGYKEVSPGRYVSADGLRQVRFGPHELRSSQLHGHFEAYDKVGGRVIENTRVNIIGN
jgi:hypothetical protein